MGNAKNTPTSNGFIPTTWAPGGGSDEEKQGLKSITISPAITTTPALDSLFPIYWEDLTEEQKQDGVSVDLTTSTELKMGDEFTVTITPTADWYGYNGDEFGEKGEPVTYTASVFMAGRLSIDGGASEDGTLSNKTVLFEASVTND